MANNKLSTLLNKKKTLIFLNTLKETANVTKACEIVNLKRNTAYWLKKQNDKFAQDWDDAIEYAIDVLEEEARRRAYEGVQKPVFHQGRECGYIQDYSDSLLMFLLKKYRPEYRDRVGVEHTGNVDITVKCVHFGEKEKTQVGENKGKMIDITPKNKEDLPPPSDDL